MIDNELFPRLLAKKKAVFSRSYIDLSLTCSIREPKVRFFCLDYEVLVIVLRVKTKGRISRIPGNHLAIAL
jgi:hypothetical protein